MKKFFLLFSLFLLFFVTFGQIPVNYYADAEGKKNKELKTALSIIISDNYKQRTYSQLWTDFYTTDARPDGKVWDMYSNCTFTFGVDQDGGQAAPTECVKYNREHSIPNSWFGGQNYPMYSDLFHLYPTDKYVNAERDNFPYGEADNNAKIYENGSKKGKSITESGYTGTVFEPIDEYKGDFARTYFYVTTRYINIDFARSDEAKVVFTYNNSENELTDYAINLFLKWHRNDPVSQKETERNNAVYGFQNNRNPFIDYPELVEHIWGNLTDKPWYIETSVTRTEPPPIKITKCYNGILVEGDFHDAKIEIYSVMGQNLLSKQITDGFISLNHLQRGIYIIKIDKHVEKIVW
jgi:endonuclease I